MLVEWGRRLKKGVRKFSCEKIINAEMESAEAVKTLLDELKGYYPETNPEVEGRKKAVEAKAELKVCQKRKRQSAARGKGSSSTPQVEFTPVWGAGTGASPRVTVAETQSMLEQFGIVIPPSSDFAAVLRVYEAAAAIAEELEDHRENKLLRKQVKGMVVVNLDLEGELLDREDKLECCTGQIIPNLQEEDRLLWGEIESLKDADCQISRCEEEVSMGRSEVGRVGLVEQELTEARLLETEVKNRMKSLEEQVQHLESELLQVEADLPGARSLGFTRCRDLVVVQDPDVDLGVLQLSNEV